MAGRKKKAGRRGFATFPHRNQLLGGDLTLAAGGVVFTSEYRAVILHEAVHAAMHDVIDIAFEAGLQGSQRAVFRHVDFHLAAAERRIELGKEKSLLGFKIQAGLFGVEIFGRGHEKQNAQRPAGQVRHGLVGRLTAPQEGEIGIAAEKTQARVGMKRHFPRQRLHVRLAGFENEAHVSRCGNGLLLQGENFIQAAINSVDKGLPKMRAERDDFFGRERLTAFQLAVKFLAQAGEHDQVMWIDCGTNDKVDGHPEFPYKNFPREAKREK
ncbi:hypothetical protein L6R21_19535 [bacterium]|nr:hypothetical protein [bacterium]